eukprot:scaffold263723_cov15-Tisochrysis_lutea.AAC.2
MTWCARCAGAPQDINAAEVKRLCTKLQEGYDVSVAPSHNIPPDMEAAQLFVQAPRMTEEAIDLSEGCCQQGGFLVFNACLPRDSSNAGKNGFEQLLDHGSFYATASSVFV